MQEKLGEAGPSYKTEKQAEENKETTESGVTEAAPTVHQNLSKIRVEPGFTGEDEKTVEFTSDLDDSDIELEDDAEEPDDEEQEPDDEEQEPDDEEREPDDEEQEPDDEKQEPDDKEQEPDEDNELEPEDEKFGNDMDGADVQMEKSDRLGEKSGASRTAVVITEDNEDECVIDSDTDDCEIISDEDEMDGIQKIEDTKNKNKPVRDTNSSTGDVDHGKSKTARDIDSKHKNVTNKNNKSQHKTVSNKDSESKHKTVSNKGNEAKLGIATGNSNKTEDFIALDSGDDDDDEIVIESDNDNEVLNEDSESKNENSLTVDGASDIKDKKQTKHTKLTGVVPTKSGKFTVKPNKYAPVKKKQGKLDHLTYSLVYSSLLPSNLDGNNERLTREYDQEIPQITD